MLFILFNIPHTKILNNTQKQVDKKYRTYFIINANEFVQMWTSAIIINNYQRKNEKWQREVYILKNVYLNILQKIDILQYIIKDSF